MEGAIYENLRAQISSALQGSRLLQQVQQHAARLEQRVAERTAELIRLSTSWRWKSLSASRLRKPSASLNEGWNCVLSNALSSWKSANRDWKLFPIPFPTTCERRCVPSTALATCYWKTMLPSSIRRGSCCWKKCRRRPAHGASDRRSAQAVAADAREMHRQEINLTILVHEVVASQQQSQPERQVELVIQRR